MVDGSGGARLKTYAVAVLLLVLTYALFVFVIAASLLARG